MKIRDLYKEIVDIGIKNDPRSPDLINNLLAEKKKFYQSLESEKRELFDEDSLWNPYADTRSFVCKEDLDIKTVMVGIDIEVQEVLLFDRLRSDRSLDMLISHHPEGRAYANFYEVMDLHVDILKNAGLSLSLAQDLISQRKKEVERKVLPHNFLRTIQVCKLLDVAYLCVHTPADNCAFQFLKRYFEENKPSKLKDIIDLLLELPEFKEAYRNNFGPRIINGSEENRIEKFFLEMTGGTEGSETVYENLVKEGYDTIISMHLSEKHFKRAKESHLNIVIAGHIPSDTLGLNILFDELEKKEKLNFIACSGFQRFSHK